MITFEVNFEKLRMAARFWLLGMANHDPRYFNVIDALEYCLLKHDGQRDGGDPEAIHQLRIFHGLRTMHNHITSPHIKYSGVFLHDVVEDKNVPITEIETLFGAEVADVVNLLDPDCIVLGGGVSNLEALYPAVAERLGRLVFSDACTTPVVRAALGDSSGVFGAAMLAAPAR